MLYSGSNQLYKYEHGLTTAAEQRAEDVRAGEAAAALRDLRLALGAALRLRRHARPVAAVTRTRGAGSARPLSDVR